MRGDTVLAEQTVVGACLNTEGRPMRFPAEMTEAMRTAMADSE
jgi:acyl-CoA thioesterase FadM